MIDRRNSSVQGDLYGCRKEFVVFRWRRSYSGWHQVPQTATNEKNSLIWKEARRSVFMLDFQVIESATMSRKSVGLNRAGHY